MIFAHAPASFLLTYALKKYWQPSCQRKQIISLYILAMIGGIFPDIDLFYYYLSSATFSHHEVFTHSVLFYSIVCGLIYFFGYWRKNKFLQTAASLFFLGIISHFLADSLGAGVVWLWPFSKTLYGLDSLNWYRHSYLGKNFFVINYGLEFLLFIIVLLLAIKKYIKKNIWRIIFYFSAAGIYIIFLFFIVYVNGHLFHGNIDMYYGDIDGDKIINKYDLDLDGDGLLNIIDPDIDNDGVKNRLAMQKATAGLEGIWYDPTEGGLVEIPLRLGLVTNTDFIERVFANIGIFIRTEMEEDYKNNPTDYISAPKDKTFERQAGNWQTYLRHKNKLYLAAKQIEIYDILFFKNGYVALAVSDKNNKLAILEANPQQKKVILTNLNEIVQRKGPVLSLGRLLP